MFHSAQTTCNYLIITHTYTPLRLSQTQRLHKSLKFNIYNNCLLIFTCSQFWLTNSMRRKIPLREQHSSLWNETPIFLRHNQNAIRQRSFSKAIWNGWRYSSAPLTPPLVLGCVLNGDCSASRMPGKRGPWGSRQKNSAPGKCSCRESFLFERFELTGWCLISIADVFGWSKRCLVEQKLWIQIFEQE